MRTFEPFAILLMSSLMSIAAVAQTAPPSPLDYVAVAETVPGFEMSAWVALFVPAKTPKEVVVRLSKEVAAMLKEPDVVKIFNEQQILPFYKDPEELTQYIKAELEKWDRVIKTAGIKGD